MKKTSRLWLLQFQILLTENETQTEVINMSKDETEMQEANSAV